MKFIKSYKLWLLTLLLMFLKFYFLIALTFSTGASYFNFYKAIHSVANPDIFIAFICIFISFAFIFNRKGHILYLLIFDTLITVIMLFDLWYYRGFGSFISMHLLSQTSNLDNLSDSVFSMARGIDLIFIVDLIFLSIIGIFDTKKKTVIKRNFILFLCIFLCSVSYISYMHNRSDVRKLDSRIIFRICWTPNQTMWNLSPLGYHIYDAYNYYIDCQPLKLNGDENSQISKWFNDNKENLPDNEFKGEFKGKNVIVLQVESLENFVINREINGQEITPNINKLLKNSYYFSNFHEQVYNGTSSDADLMTNTSIYPIRRGSTFFRYPSNSYNSMPKILEGEGYSTLAIHPDKGAYWNWLNSLKSIGFQKCIDASYFKTDESIGLGLSDGSYLRQVEPVIKSRKNPFYVFMVTLTSHSPFNLPKEYRELKLDSALDETKLGGYFQSIHYTDKHIGLLIDKLRADGTLDNTVFVIYGDHTGIHKYYQDEVEKIKPSEDWWIDDQKKIPLIIYSKDLQGKELKLYGGQIDTMPTLLYLLGIQSSSYDSTVMGRNLMNTKRNFTVLSDKTYKGDFESKSQKDHEIMGIDLADKIIRSNYFKNYK